MSTDNPNQKIGSKLRFYRQLNGMSQQDLATPVGITYQQLQKYERGINNIPSARLLKLANILGVPVTAIYEELNQQLENKAFVNSDLTDANSAQLLRHFSKIEDDKVKESIIKLVRELSQNPS